MKVYYNKIPFHIPKYILEFLYILLASLNFALLYNI